MSNYIVRNPSQWDIDNMSEGDSIQTIEPTFFTKLRRKYFDKSRNYIKINFVDGNGNKKLLQYDQEDILIVRKGYKESRTNRYIRAFYSRKDKVINTNKILYVDGNVEALMFMDINTNMSYMVSTDEIRNILNRIDYQLNNMK